MPLYYGLWTQMQHLNSLGGGGLLREDIWGHRELCPSATGDLQFKGVRALLRFS